MTERPEQLRQTLPTTNCGKKRPRQALALDTEPLRDSRFEGVLSGTAGVGSAQAAGSPASAIGAGTRGVSTEDGLADTLVPRLIRMGADLSHIAFITQSRPPNGKPRPFMDRINSSGDVEAAYPTPHNNPVNE